MINEASELSIQLEKKQGQGREIGIRRHQKHSRRREGNEASDIAGNSSYETEDGNDDSKGIGIRG